MNELTKVKVLTVIGKPIGAIVHSYKREPQNYYYLYWVRLKNGVLLKDVTENEIEIIK